MIKENIRYPEFSSVDFIRLYCAISFTNGLSPIIIHHELEKKLYEFYSYPEFSILFQDICPREDGVNQDDSYLDLTTALNAAQLFGLLTPVNGVGDTKSIVSCDEFTADEIISSFDAEMVYRMTNLVNTLQNGYGPKLAKK